jgi:hypothetical protein
MSRRAYQREQQDEQRAAERALLERLQRVSAALIACRSVKSLNPNYEPLIMAVRRSLMNLPMVLREKHSAKHEAHLLHSVEVEVRRMLEAIDEHIGNAKDAVHTPALVAYMDAEKHLRPSDLAHV